MFRLCAVLLEYRLCRLPFRVRMRLLMQASEAKALDLTSEEKEALKEQRQFRATRRRVRVVRLQQAARKLQRKRPATRWRDAVLVLRPVSKGSSSLL